LYPKKGAYRQAYCRFIIRDIRPRAQRTKGPKDQRTKGPTDRSVLIRVHPWLPPHGAIWEGVTKHVAWNRRPESSERPAAVSSSARSATSAVQSRGAIRKRLRPSSSLHCPGQTAPATSRPGENSRGYTRAAAIRVPWCPFVVGIRGSRVNPAGPRRDLLQVGRREPRLSPP